MSKNSKAQNPQPAMQPHPVEWVLGCLSAAVVLAILVFLVVEDWSRRGGVPQFELRIVRQIEQPNGTGVVIEVYNRGKATAADVEISGAVEGLSSRREVMLDYAPAESAREVTLVFPKFVALDALTLEVLGYHDP